MATGASKDSPKPPSRPPPPRKAQTVPAYLDRSDDIQVDVPPLPLERIRWFYLENGKCWKPFSGFDSLMLEQARCHLMIDVSVDPHAQSREVEVLGNMYLVDIHVVEPATVRPIYWPITNPWPVMRGTWFEAASSDRWLPVTEKDAAILEEAHTRKDWREKAKADAKLTAWAPPKPDEPRRGSQPQNIVILNQVTLTGYEAVWTGDNEIMKVKTDLASKLWTKMGEKVAGKSQLYGASRLMRGYQEPCSWEDKMPPVGHLVFVVHGIGQNMDVSDIVKSASDLRDICKQTALKHFPEYWNEKRVEIIPIEWRTWLSLDQGVLTSITPHGVKSLRDIINNSVLDIMFYLSPLYGPELLDGLRWQLHKKYKEFMTRNPAFISSGGTISLFAHSLGSVMCYDLLYESCRLKGLLEHEKQQKETVTESLDSPDCPKRRSSDDELDELLRMKVRVAELEAKLGLAQESKALKFNVDHFFAVGSPLGIFIMLREHSQFIKKDFKGADSFLPSCVCKRIHNVHHPSDPVAYRLEPLICPAYAQIKPVRMDSVSSKPTPKSKSLAEGPVKPAEPVPAKNSWSQSLFTAVMKSVGSSSTESTSKTLPANKIYDDDTKLVPEERLKERLDFMLRESLVENSYLNSLTAHTCYWSNADCAMYILLQLYSYKKDNSKL